MTPTRRTAGRALTLVGSVLAAAGTAHTLVNLRALRLPSADPEPTTETVSVLVPARDEERVLDACLASVRAQTGVPDLEIVVLDDGSTDATAAIAARHAAADPRVRVLPGTEPAPGWAGKPWACARLADDARGTVLVFCDADVQLAPHAVAATVELARRHDLAIVCPYPRQQIGSTAERLVQPLLQWSWLTTLPLRLAERSPRPSLSAGNGQVLAVDAAVYRRAGGHGAVRDRVVEDVALVRAIKAVGGRGGVVDGTHLASCRMYRGWDELREGYTKSLWSAFGSPAGAVAVVAGLGVVYVVPAVAAMTGSAVGAVGYLAAVTGRVAVARRTGGRPLPDSLAHPASVAVLGALVARSWRARRRGTLVWKGRSLTVVR